MPNIAALWVDPEARSAEIAAAVEIPSELPPVSISLTPDSNRSWVRLAVAVVIGALGSVGMWSVVVALPVVQGEFAASRGTASLAYTMVMLGFGSGGVLTGKITDRYGIVAAIGLGIGILGLGYIGAGMSSTIWQFILVNFAIGLGSSATFGPLMAEASHWFERYRGLAVAIAASGNYIGGAIWPPLVNLAIQSAGWRSTHIAIGIFTALAMAAALLVLRMLMGAAERRSHVNAPPPRVNLRLSTNVLTAILALASIGCCVAMSMPQVHIVAYCGDLGYGVARGAEMLSLMLGFGIVSRIGSGFSGRPDRRHPHAVDRLDRARHGAVALRVLRQPGLALRHLGAVRPVPGRHRAELCHHRARGDAGGRGGHARRHRDLCLGARDVVRRLGVRRDLRRHRLLRGRLHQRARLERAQHFHHGGTVAPRPRQFGKGRRRVCGENSRQLIGRRLTQSLFFTRFLNANRYPLRLKTLYTACPALSSTQPMIFRLPSASRSSV